jgi:hypothetical protein
MVMNVTSNGSLLAFSFWWSLRSVRLAGAHRLASINQVALAD